MCPAHAESWGAKCIVNVGSPNSCVPPRDDRAVAAYVTYADTDNMFCVYDRWADGHSAVGIIWPVGHPERDIRQWVYWGEGGGDCNMREASPRTPTTTSRPASASGPATLPDAASSTAAQPSA